MNAETWHVEKGKPLTLWLVFAYAAALVIIPFALLFAWLGQALLGVLEELPDHPGAPGPK